MKFASQLGDDVFYDHSSAGWFRGTHQLNMALRIARVLKLKEKEASLRERYAHIEAVFNARFRG